MGVFSRKIIKQCHVLREASHVRVAGFWIQQRVWVVGFQVGHSWIRDAHHPPGHQRHVPKSEIVNSWDPELEWEFPTITTTITITKTGVGIVNTPKVTNLKFTAASYRNVES